MAGRWPNCWSGGTVCVQFTVMSTLLDAIMKYGDDDEIARMDKVDRCLAVMLYQLKALEETANTMGWGEHAESEMVQSTRSKLARQISDLEALLKNK